MKIIFKSIFTTLVIGLQSTMLWAQTPSYPSRPITIMIPMGPGGTSDVLGRLISPILSERLGQPVIVENRAGANGLIGEEFFSKVKPDGYTIMLSSGSASSNLWLHPLNYDPRKAFVPVTLFATLPMAMIVANKVGAKSLKEFVDVAKKSPAPLNYGHWGEGSVAPFKCGVFKNGSGNCDEWHSL